MDGDCIIIGTDGAAWLETTDPGGRHRWSYVGVKDLDGLRDFCACKRIQLVFASGVRFPEKRASQTDARSA